MIYENFILSLIQWSNKFSLDKDDELIERATARMIVPDPS
jgi:hypothetical protein